MTESTTEHGTEPVGLEKAETEPTAEPADTSELHDGASSAGAEDAGTEDWVTPTEAEPESGRKRGRRARRAAAAARAKSEPTASAAPDVDAEDTDSTGDIDSTDNTDSTDDTDEAATGSKTARRAKVAAATKAASGTKAGSRTKTGSGTRPGTKTGKGAKASKTTAVPDDGKASGPRLDGPRLRRVITGLLVVAVLLAAVLLVQLVKGPGNAGKLEAQQERRDAARQAADTVIPKLYSYDYRQINANTAEQIQLTTGAISDQIRSETAPALQQLAPKTKAIVQAVSLGSAVLDSSDNGPDVQVLVFLNQAVSSNLLPAPRLDRNRVVATMRLIDGQWKVADIKAL